jgi:FxLD family lantipeptide
VWNQLSNRLGWSEGRSEAGRVLMLGAALGKRMCGALPQQKEPGQGDVYLDISIVEGGPAADQLLRLTHGGCGSTCVSVCTSRRRHHQIASVTVPGRPDLWARPGTAQPQGGACIATLMQQ